MKSDGIIVKGWNDNIEASDLELDTSLSKDTKKVEKLIPVPDDDLKEDLKVN